MTNTPLIRIQNATDVLIKKHGTQSTADLLEALSLEKNHKAYTFNINLKQTIIEKIIAVFKINTKLLATSSSTNYKDARKLCFYLLKTHCNMSLAAIKSEFKGYSKSRNNINAHITSMKEIIELPAINKDLYQKYTTIENYIQKIKTQK